MLKGDALQVEWEKYVANEIAWCKPFLTEHGYRLDERQVHTLGERYLMLARRDVGGGGLKVILTASTSDGTRAIVKVSRDAHGIAEIEREHTARSVITKLPFSYQLLTPPTDLLHEYYKGGLVSIAAYIPQDMPFIDRPVEEQFSLTLAMLKLQESVHAATYEHARQIVSTFGMSDSRWYLRQAKQFVRSTQNIGETQMLAERALHELELGKERIEQYCGFMTHADFVPHNFRVYQGVPYLIDYASIHFGNKHESWGRFMNFMTLYNPDLNRALHDYFVKNRSIEEAESLRLMRLYKNIYLLSYYADTLPGTKGSMHMLTKARITFWTESLRALLDRRELSDETRVAYIRERDVLRDDGEKARQQGLH